MILEKPWALHPAGRVCCWTNKCFPSMTEWFVNSFKKSLQGWLPALAHLVRCLMDAALKDVLEKVLPSTCCSGFQLLLRPSALLLLGCKIWVLGDGEMFHWTWTHTATRNQGRKTLEKKTTELSLISLSPKHPGSTKTQCRNYQEQWEIVFYSFSVLLSTQGRIYWN